MPFNTPSKKHWSHVWSHFALDGYIWLAAFITATIVRFSGDDSSTTILTALLRYAPGILAGSLTLSSVCYLFSLYSRHRPCSNLSRRYLLVIAAVLVSTIVTLSYGSIDFSARIGRGVLILALPSATVLLLLHHHYLRLQSSAFQEKLLLIAGCQKDLSDSDRFLQMNQNHYILSGIVTTHNFQLPATQTALGDISDLKQLVKIHHIDCILATSSNLRDDTIATPIRSLRYSGTSVTNLTTLCEELYQAVPLSLVDSSWLLSASSQPDWAYIRKFKRIFDVITAIFFLIVLAPFLILGMISVRLGSKGPIFYSQIRSGRFSRDFKVTKLRTMKTDAEKSGAQWSSENDERITKVGKFLRLTRIDEIPQLWCILTGEMSFVGPRPERPEFVEQLAQEIPFYNERLLIQPGLTGWAQVNYPYGASVDDAARKLEYDLYYMKHMSVVLDLFILLDTVKTILRGGTSKSRGGQLTEFLDKLSKT
ncbi:MAG: exopolysaccharide biosynthesis polyprenyl glycosylphosphotransferase [Verrucomicrobiales bacterium]|nr:exopolysaccharide biosynthesis polyprenyl glycosylphosphotransferase [Verrucomicrobiales bacterium]